MKQSIMIIKNDKIIIQSISGDTRVVTLDMLWEELMSAIQKDIHLIGLISDYTIGELDMSSIEIDKLMGYFETNFDTFHTTKLAFVVRNQDNFLFPLYVSSQYPKLKSKVFYSIDSAMEWVKADIEESILQNKY